MVDSGDSFYKSVKKEGAGDSLYSDPMVQLLMQSQIVSPKTPRDTIKRIRDEYVQNK